MKLKDVLGSWDGLIGPDECTVRIERDRVRITCDAWKRPMTLEGAEVTERDGEVCFQGEVAAEHVVVVLRRSGSALELGWLDGIHPLHVQLSRPGIVVRQREVDAGASDMDEARSSSRKRSIATARLLADELSVTASDEPAPARGATVTVGRCRVTFVWEVREDTEQARRSGWPDQIHTTEVQCERRGAGGVFRMERRVRGERDRSAFRNACPFQLPWWYVFDVDPVERFVRVLDADNARVLTEGRVRSLQLDDGRARATCKSWLGETRGPTLVDIRAMIELVETLADA